MNDFSFGALLGFFVSFILFIVLCGAFGTPGFKDKQIVPINCVVDYHRDGIHYCILENK